jgi:DNA-binding transcriptional LysR family regulator
MNDTDLNLLTALDALLAEGSVSKAAVRLGLSPSAMSRTLARLRSATGDPLLVRAGRGLVPTPRAFELRERVQGLTRDVLVVLSPQTSDLDLRTLERTFTIRASEGFVTLFSTSLVMAVTEAAPHVRLRFAPKPDKDARPLREGLIDLDIGVLGLTAPEMRIQLIFRDDFIGVVRLGHPLLTGPLSPERYAAGRHVVASRRGAFAGPVDEALKELGLRRDVVAVVTGFPDAIHIARRSDLIALVPRSCLASADLLTEGIATFELPVRTSEIVISAMWHPRMDADSAHRWLRDLIKEICHLASSSKKPATMARPGSPANSTSASK